MRVIKTVKWHLLHTSVSLQPKHILKPLQSFRLGFQNILNEKTDNKRGGQFSIPSSLLSGIFSICLKFDLIHF